ncbi:MAG: hypothetical protein M1269_08850 [Chloroflexi bacterium]|nr:hypothetical protein [Chloroflexota bacterium]
MKKKTFTCILFFIAMIIGMFILSTPLRAGEKPLHEQLSPGDWPLVLHDIHNTSCSPTKLHLPLKLRWRKTCTDNSDNSEVRALFNLPILYAQGQLFITRVEYKSAKDQKPSLMVIDGSSGKVVREFPGYYAPQVLLPDRAICFKLEGESCYLTSLSRVNGKEFARNQLKDLGLGEKEIRSCSILPYKNKYFGKTLFHLFALDRNLKTLQYTDKDESRWLWGAGPPCVLDKWIIIGTGHRLEFRDYDDLYKGFYFYDGGNIDPMSWNDHLYTKGWNQTAREFIVKGEDINLLSLSCNQKDLPHCILEYNGKPLLIEKYGFGDYGPTYWNSKAVCYDILERKVLWKLLSDDNTGLAAAENVVAFSNNGNIEILDGGGGHCLQTITLPNGKANYDTHIIIADSRLFVLSSINQKGKVYQFTSYLSCYE